MCYPVPAQCRRNAGAMPAQCRRNAGMRASLAYLARDSVDQMNATSTHLPYMPLAIGRRADGDMGLEPD
jgi:hypothetical protein